MEAHITEGNSSKLNTYRIEPQTRLWASEDFRTARFVQMDATGQSNVLGPRESTGIARLDLVIGGGFLRPSITALVGASGTGTTSFCKTFLVSSLKRGRSVVLVCGDETPSQYLRNLKTVGGFDAETCLRQGRLFVVDLYQLCCELLGIRDLADLSLIENASFAEMISRARERVISEMKRRPQGFNMVIDSLTAFAPFIGIRDASRAILEGQRIAREGNHVVIVTAHEGALEGNLVQEVRKLAHNVIKMRARWVRSNLKRQMIIEKMSFTDVKQPILEYTITDAGVEVI